MNNTLVVDINLGSLGTSSSFLNTFQIILDLITMR